MTKRLCYYLDPSMKNARGQYVPAAVVERVAGYTPARIELGSDYDAAFRCVEDMNRELGLSPRDVQAIVCSSMFPQSR